MLTQYFNSEHQIGWTKYLNQFAYNNRDIFIGFSQFRPQSRGSVRLASRSPMDAPLIDPAYYSNNQDLISTIRAMNLGLQAAETPGMAPFIRYSQIPIPGCEVVFCRDRPMSQCYGYLACIAQTYNLSFFAGPDLVGTVRMGNGTSPDGVVDERLRVRNVSRLRVIDSSVMPTIPNAHPMAATMMIGEKGAHMVMQDNGLGGT